VKVICNTQPNEFLKHPKTNYSNQGVTQWI